MNELTRKIIEAADPQYRAFSLPLMPELDEKTVIGVRTPVLRGLAKDYRNTETAKAFMQELPHTYYEELNLHIFLLSHEKDFGTYMEKLEQILPEVRCWSSCDTIRNPMLKKHTDELFPYIEKWLGDEHVYTVRLAIGFLMAYYLGDDYDKDHLRMAVSAQGEEYYINMMIAWYLATAMIRHYDDVIVYLEKGLLNPFVHRMTIRKATESYRIPQEIKDYLKTLR